MHPLTVLFTYYRDDEGGLKTVNCAEHSIHLGANPGVYHPVKVFGGRDGLCREAHAFGQALRQGHRDIHHRPAPENLPGNMDRSRYE